MNLTYIDKTSTTNNNLAAELFCLLIPYLIYMDDNLLSHKCSQLFSGLHNNNDDNYRDDDNMIQNQKY